MHMTAIIILKVYAVHNYTRYIVMVPLCRFSLSVVHDIVLALYVPALQELAIGMHRLVVCGWLSMSVCFLA